MEVGVFIRLGSSKETCRVTWRGNPPSRGLLVVDVVGVSTIFCLEESNLVYLLVRRGEFE